MICNQISSYFPKVLSNGLILYTACICQYSVNILPPFLNSLLLLCFVSLILVSYWKVIYVGAGSPLEYEPLQFKRLEDVLSGEETPPDIITSKSVLVKGDGTFRFCRNCKVWKPDRCHHCSKCNRCILKMDHHCPWFAACVGFRNQKYFVQFLNYVTLYALYILVVTSVQIYSWFSASKYQSELLNLNLLITWLLSLICSIAMFAFTSYTIWLITKNETTVETYQWNNIRHDLQIFEDSLGSTVGTPENVFDLGSRSKNLSSVMGSTWKEYLLPVENKSLNTTNPLDNKGLYFTIKSDKYQASFSRKYRTTTKIIEKVNATTFY